MKKCSRCKKFKSVKNYTKNPSTKDGLNYYCRECIYKSQAKYKNSFKGIEYEKRRKERYKTEIKARSIINNGLKTGKFIKESCFLYGQKLRTQAHHLIYSYPEKVVWLCIRHHHEVHLMS